MTSQGQVTIALREKLPTAVELQLSEDSVKARSTDLTRGA
jgi:hypothetical protein